MKKKSRILIFPLLAATVLLIPTGSCKKDGDGEQPITTNTLVVTTLATINITSTSATFEGKAVSSDGDMTFDIGFCWSNVASEPDYPENLYWVDLYRTADNFSGVVDFLTPGTTFYVRAFAKNTKGIAYGKVVSFSTPGSVTGPIVFNPDLTYGSLSDIDGNNYKTIQIGTQTWMAENLKTTKYNDGTPIPIVTGQDEWSSLSTGAYCWYINQPAAYKNIYGAVYNWYTVKTGKLCPNGWHVPSDTEWTTLTDYVGDSGYKLKETGYAHWIAPPSYVAMFAATNESGFTALPGGYRGAVRTFPLTVNLGYEGLWWSSTDSDWEVDNIIIRTMDYTFDGVGRQLQGLKKAGLSCRCVKD
jgi:uncharacterized protein (TIGR02145 family)